VIARTLATHADVIALAKKTEEDVEAAVAVTKLSGCSDV
jgi:hypothetical protein